MLETLGFLLTIAALGDSVTVGPKPVRGRAPAAASAFVAILGRQLGEPAINAGVAGDTSRQMLARLGKVLAPAPPRRARRPPPRVVLIMAGLNDAARVDPGAVALSEARVSEAEFEKNLTAIVEGVKKARAQPVLLTPNPMTRAYKYQNMPFYQENDINDGLAPYADATRRVARVTGACLVDIFGDWLARSDHRRLVSDGLHPNAEGHRLIAAKVMEACGAVVKPPGRGAAMKPK